jgi:peptidoglycan/xylan/chitin deacetylase (PgdA/CDA1 family)
VPPPAARHAAYADMWTALQPLEEGAREAVLDELRAWAGADNGIRPTHRTLEPDDVAALAHSGTFAIGAHTITHPRLSQRRVDAQAYEIAHGKALVEQWAGRPVRHFAYPFGGLRDYTGRTARLVAGAGFASACATWKGLATAATDPFQLPRQHVPDVGGEAFAELLDGFFAAG